ncbi:CEN-like protein 1 [Gigantopelta aegis]|uniref:CEN-like protein 1 n=1 Tax=Gigantopelta aegis TaxID=1735272 RepID=UPI001B88908D|nr:CEN-like protein 1 [Gigantopelta aegis]
MLWTVLLLRLCLHAALTTVVPACDSRHGSECRNRRVNKLHVFFHGHRVMCGQRLRKTLTASSPVLVYAQATEGSRYLVVMVDPDAPYHCAPPGRSLADFIHYAAIMEPHNGRLSSVFNLISYQGPNPPIGVHRYQIYLYNWSRSGIPVLRNNASVRTNFNRTKFQAENHLARHEAFFQFKVKK